MTDQVRFVVWGVVIPKGSWIPIRRRTREGEKLILIPNNQKEFGLWVRHAKKVAQEAMGDRELFDDAVRVLILVSMPLRGASPKSKPKHWRFPIRKGRDADSDKLERSILDTLTGTVMTDDVLVVDLQIRKRYEGRGDSLPTPGVRIIVEDMSDALL